MNIEEVLSENLIVLDMKARNKEEAIRELAEILYKERKIFDKELFVKDVYLREAEGIILLYLMGNQMQYK